MTNRDVQPFSDEPLEEVPLLDPPLVKVLAQLRFPPVASIGNQLYVGDFQECLRSRYPILRPESRVEAVFGPQGVVNQAVSNVWRFVDLEEAWVVTLGSDFVALETTAYTSRTDFIDRLGQVFDALNHLAEPTPVVVYNRLGVRYINRLVGDEATTQLQSLISEHIYGPLAMFPDSLEPVSIGQLNVQLDGPMLQARWARLPNNSSLLPDIPLVDEISWTLDTDVFFDGQAPFEPAAVTQLALHASEHAYRMFRWAMSAENYIEPKRAR